MSSVRENKTMTTTTTTSSNFSSGGVPVVNNFSAVDKLGVAAADAAMRGCATYVRTNGLKVADLDRLVALLKVHAKAAVDAAMADAKNALEANMGAVAESTFVASFTLAGVTAAKEYFGLN